MLDDSFKVRYGAVPIAISEQSTTLPTLLHNHAEFECLMLYSGSATVTVAGKRLSVSAGDVVCIPPFASHAVNVEAAPYHHRCICFDVDILPDRSMAKRLKEGKLRFCDRIPREAAATVRKRAEQIYQAVQEGGSTLLLEGVAYVSLFLSCLLQENLVDHSVEHPTDTAFCREVLLWIEQSYADPITSEQAAKALSFHHSYFCRKFKQQFGMPFSAYLTLYRIAYAEHLLEEKHRSIADIAADCGFSSPEYFTRCFKKHRSVSPSEYRKSQHSTENRSI